MNTKIDTVHTPCKNCVFAIYEHKTQVDCALDYISKLKNNSEEILEAYDEEKEFYIINKKKCVGYRENKWFKQFDLENASIEEKTKKYFETNYLHYSIIIDLRSYTLLQLKDLLEHVSKLDYKPQKITLIRYSGLNLEFPFDKIKALLSECRISIPWRVQTILDKNDLYKDILHNYVSTNNYRFIVSITQPTDHHDIDRLIVYSNRVVHHDLGSLYVLSNDNYSITIFPTTVYKFASFHGQNILIDKTQYEIV